ncbi:hypothetical protein BN1723_017029 [Verticillium longisporum]|uniref:rRNA biogenesis protein RRP36 n=1 Tax=Verticillium longisporum TaxID=100787 RepID=A0A0G4KFV6_VERLO|nr:hypothetical protein BN1723_017029 [Verticillium longisporum]
MAFGKLFAYQGNPRTTAILVVAKANGVELDLVESDGSKPTEEHLTANPLGKIPAFLGEDGYALSEAIAVAIYITSQNEKTTLLGKTKQDYASILRWMSFVNSEVLPPLGGWFRPLLGRDPYNKKAVEDSSKVALKAVGAIEQHLQNNTYLGKQPFYLKKSEQKKRLLTEQFKGMKKKQVNKVIERKRKKVAAKEKMELDQLQRR